MERPRTRGKIINFLSMSSSKPIKAVSVKPKKKVQQESRIAISSILLTPDSTSTKDATQMSEVKSEDIISQGDASPPHLVDHSYVRFDQLDSSSFSIKDEDSMVKQHIFSRSKSDTHLDSPKATKPKVTKCLVTDDVASSHLGRNINMKAISAEQLVTDSNVSSKGRSRPKGKGKTEVVKVDKSNKKILSKSGPPPPKVIKPVAPSQKRSKSSSSKPDSDTRLLTDFFPVRRSNRTTAVKLKKQAKEDIESAILNRSEDGLKVVEIPGKGRGVIATKPFRRGDFVVEYSGDLVDSDIAKEREKIYEENPDFGCYMYYFVFQEKNYCVDATKETGLLGRLLNHSKSGNCMTKVVGIRNQPYLILVAAQDISQGEELLYDYGDRSKMSLESHPWLAY